MAPKWTTEAPEAAVKDLDQRASVRVPPYESQLTLIKVCLLTSTGWADGSSLRGGTAQSEGSTSSAFTSSAFTREDFQRHSCCSLSVVSGAWPLQGQCSLRLQQQHPKTSALVPSGRALQKTLGGGHGRKDQLEKVRVERTPTLDLCCVDQ